MINRATKISYINSPYCNKPFRRGVLIYLRIKFRNFGISVDKLYK